MKYVSIVLITLVLSTQVLSFDVIGQKHTILVTKKGSGETAQVGFQHCMLDKKAEVISKTCEQIGASQSYSISKLKKIKSSEILEAAGKTVFDVAIVAGLIYGGWVLGGAALGSGTGTILGDILGTMVGAGAGGALGAGTGVAVTTTIKKLNPVRQFKQGFVLSDQLINDQEIKKADKKVLYMVEILNEILL